MVCPKLLGCQILSMSNVVKGIHVQPLIYLKVKGVMQY